MRILIVKLSSIGDVVHTLPAAAMLRRALPSAHISWVVERRAAALLKDSPAIDELIEIDTRAWRKRFLSKATRRDIRSSFERAKSAGKFDVAIDFQGLIKSGVIALASGAARRIGYQTSEMRESAAAIFLTEQVETRRFKHVIEKNMALARAAMPAPNDVAPTPAVSSAGSYEFPIAVAPEDERYVEGLVGGYERGYAILNPGGGWRTKLWPAGNFGLIADHLRDRYGLASVVTYGPGEEALADEVAAASRADAARPVASTLKQFVALARRARLFVGSDTGPLHIAAACRTPIVGIYGPTSPERNGPFHDSDVTIGRNLWCRADCHRRSCWHWECMDIPVAYAEQAISIRMAESYEREL